jgi:hypothetical protein
VTDEFPADRFRYFPPPPPEPRPGCAECLRLKRQESAAALRRDQSAAGDARVLLRRHLGSGH